MNCRDETEKRETEQRGRGHGANHESEIRDHIGPLRAIFVRVQCSHRSGANAKWRTANHILDNRVARARRTKAAHAGRVPCKQNESRRRATSAPVGGIRKRVTEEGGPPKVRAARRHRSDCPTVRNIVWDRCPPSRRGCKGP